MSNEEIAKEATTRIFRKCYDIGFNEDECTAIVLIAIEKAIIERNGKCGG
jgi:ADP-dependent phosphofructokinase/glucokinase